MVSRPSMIRAPVSSSFASQSRVPHHAPQAAGSCGARPELVVDADNADGGRDVIATGLVPHGCTLRLCSLWRGSSGTYPDATSPLPLSLAERVPGVVHGQSQRMAGQHSGTDR